MKSLTSIIQLSKAQEWFTANGMPYIAEALTTCTYLKVTGSDCIFIYHYDLRVVVGSISKQAGQLVRVFECNVHQHLVEPRRIKLLVPHTTTVAQMLQYVHLFTWNAAETKVIDSLRDGYRLMNTSTKPIERVWGWCYPDCPYVYGMDIDEEQAALGLAAKMHTRLVDLVCDSPANLLDMAVSGLLTGKAFNRLIGYKG